MQLDPTAQAAGARLIAYDTIGSTNEEALRLARAGERAPLWIAAKTQTAGRGRRGRTWVSEPGNLYASLLLSAPSPPDRFPELSFVAAVALHDAVTARIPGLAGRVLLKWPNDLLIDRNKFAGILVEGEGATVVIGIGVNCAHHPDGTEHPATDLAAAGVRATPDSLFAPLHGRDGGAACAMGPRRGLCRNSHRLAFPRRGNRQAGPRQDRRRRHWPGRSKLSTPPAAWFCASRMGQCRPWRRATCS